MSSRKHPRIGIAVALCVVATLAVSPAHVGAFSFDPPTDFAVDDEPTSVAVGDFNDDGRQDLALASRELWGADGDHGSVTVLLGTGDGSFGSAAVYPTGKSLGAIAVGDFNDDGAQDLAVANRGSDDVSILLGTGTGSFTPATDYAVGNLPVSIAVGDFNDDGAQDLAVADYGINSNWACCVGASNGVAVLLGKGTGSFAPAVTYSDAPFFPKRLP